MRKFDNRLRDHIKESVSMLDAIRLVGLESPNRQRKIRSLTNPSDHTPSCHIYSRSFGDKDEHFHDFSTGETGDVIKLVQLAKGCSYGEALQILSGRTSALFTRRPAPVKKIELPDLTDLFEEQPEGSAGSYETAKGWVSGKWSFLTLDDLLQYGIALKNDEKYGDVLWIPHRDQQGIVRGIKVRDFRSGAKYSVTGSTFSSGLYAVTPQNVDNSVSIIVEGESDLWCLQKWSKGQVDCFALPSGASTWRKEWCKTLEQYKVIILAFDDDEAGRNATQKALLDTGIDRTGILTPPGGRFAEAIEEADQWLEPIMKWAFNSVCSSKELESSSIIHR